MGIEREFNLYFIKKYLLMLLIVLVAFLVLIPINFIFGFIKFDSLLSLYIGICASILASMVLLRTIEKEKYFKNHHKLFTISQISHNLNDKINNLAKIDILLDSNLTEKKLIEWYKNKDKEEIDEKIQSVFPLIQKKLETILSWPDLEYPVWKDIYVKKKELESAQDEQKKLLRIVRLLRSMDEMGKKSMMLRDLSSGKGE